MTLRVRPVLGGVVGAAVAMQLAREPFPAAIRLDVATTADASLAAVASMLCWMILLYLAVCLLLGAAAALPGATGRVARSIAARAVPRAARRVIALTLGVTLATGSPLLADGAAAEPGDPRPAAAREVDWPLGRSTPVLAGTASGLPVGRLPARTVDWPLASTRDEDEVPAPAARRAGAPSVTVQPGDSLWLIAAKRLGSGARPDAIAAEWPRWYAANRDRIGPDPGVLRPGEQLVSPP
jgi:resuscitation-promoting factor RpfA